jgi:hypothetical protein
MFCFLLVPDHCITDSFFFFGTVHVDFGVVFVSFLQYAGTFVAGTTSGLYNSNSYCWLVVFIHGGLIYYGVFLDPSL